MSGNVEIIEIRIVGDGKSGKKTLEETNTGLTGLKDKAESVKAELLKGTAVIGGFYLALKKIYEAGREGAELEYAAIKFDRLAESIGTTGDALRHDLADATDGLVTKAGQMELAGELMSLGLARTHDEAVRLSAVSSQLNMNMNQLTLTLANKTTARFDALGVAAIGFKERLEEVEKQGLDTDAAFTEAFLQQAEEQIKKVGSVAETSLGTFIKFEVKMEEYGNAWKKFWSGVVINTIEGIDSIINYQEKLDNMYLDTADRVFETSESYGEYIERMIMAGAATGKFNEASAANIRMLVETGENAELLYEVYGLLTEGMYGTTKASAELQDYWETHNWDGTIKGVEQTVEVLDELESQYQMVNDAIGGVNLALDGQIEKFQEYINYMENGGAAIEKTALKIQEDYVNGLISGEEATERLRLKSVEFMYAMGEFNGLSVDEIQSKLEALGYPINTAAVYAAGLYAKILELDGASANASIDLWIRQHGNLPAGATVHNGLVDIKGSNVKMKALGGPVEAKQPYFVGERGIELFVPKTAGTIIPNHDLMSGTGSGWVGSGNATVVINYSPTMSFATKHEFEENLFPLIERAIRETQRV